MHKKTYPTDNNLTLDISAFGPIEDKSSIASEERGRIPKEKPSSLAE